MEKAMQNSNGQGKVENSDWEVNILSVESITIPKHHPRTDIGDLKSLMGSLRREGIQEPLLVSESDSGRHSVIDGTRRLKAFQKIGWKTIPCLIKKGISEADAAHLAYVKNEERKTLSVIEIAQHIKNMKDAFGYSGHDLELMGYGSPSAISLKINLLELPNSIQKQIQSGDLTAEHGRHLGKLPSEDIQKRMAKRIKDHDLTAKRTKLQVNRFLAKGKKKSPAKVQVPESDIPGVYFKNSGDMSELPNKSIALTVTSPPYHVGMEFEKGESYDEHWDNIEAVLKESARVLVDGGIMALNVGDIHNFKGKNGKSDFTQIQLVGHRYQAILRRHNIFLTDIIAWVMGTNSHSGEISKAWSNDMPHTDYRIIISHDPIYIFRKKGKREEPLEEIALQSRLTKEEWSNWAHGIWQIPRERNNEGHPRVFPDELAHRLIKMFSYIGDTVLDPFLGSGTTIKVARELGREAIGYEQEIQYKAAIMQKLGMTEIEDTIINVQQTLKADDWAPDLSAEGTPSDADDYQEAEESIAEAAEAGAEA